MYPDSAAGPSRLLKLKISAGKVISLTLEYRVMNGASEATVSPEISANLTSWLTGSGNIVTVSGPVANPNGSSTWKVRDANAVPLSSKSYLRLKVVGP